MKYTTHSAKETIDLGKKIAKQLKGGEVLAFSGELGAGKTTLIKGIAAGLSLKKVVTSPTFLLMRVYQLPKGKKIKTVVHIDCYRIKNPAEILAIGATEYFEKKDTIVLLEWPEKIKNLLPKNTLHTTIKLRVNNTRALTTSLYGTR